jgi:hypothetical protein
MYVTVMIFMTKYNKYYLFHYNIGKHLLLDLELLKERNVEKSATKKVIEIKRIDNFLIQCVSKCYRTIP